MNEEERKVIEELIKGLQMALDTRWKKIRPDDSRVERSRVEHAQDLGVFEMALNVECAHWNLVRLPWVK